MKDDKIQKIQKQAVPMQIIYLKNIACKIVFKTFIKYDIRIRMIITTVTYQYKYS